MAFTLVCALQCVAVTFKQKALWASRILMIVVLTRYLTNLLMLKVVKQQQLEQLSKFSKNYKHTFRGVYLYTFVHIYGSIFKLHITVNLHRIKALYCRAIKMNMV